MSAKKKIDRPIPFVPAGQTKLPDSGHRHVYPSGAERERAMGKGRYDLIPPSALRRVAQHFENGAEKYAERNWEKGVSQSDCMDSLLRHAQEYLDGDRREDHLAAVIWNAMVMMDQEKKGHLMKIDDSFLDLPWQVGGDARRQRIEEEKIEEEKARK